MLTNKVLLAQRMYYPKEVEIRTCDSTNDSMTKGVEGLSQLCIVVLHVAQALI